MAGCHSSILLEPVVGKVVVLSLCWYFSYTLHTVGRFLNAWLNVCVSGKKGNCEFNFCVCTWLYVVCTRLTHLLRSFKCDCGKKPAIRNY